MLIMAARPFWARRCSKRAETVPIADNGASTDRDSSRAAMPQFARIERPPASVRHILDVDL